MRRGGDALISVGVLALIMVALATMDVRVRERLGDLLQGASGAGVDGMGNQLQGVVAALFTVVRDQSMANAPLTAFVIVAVILTVFMVRT